MNATQRARSRFRWGVTEAKPSPTEADLAAHLYDVTFTYPDTGTSLSFAVLALDDTHAIVLAMVRMMATDRTYDVATMTGKKRTLETSGEAMAHMLAIETADTFSEVQSATWVSRATGPPRV